MKDRKRLVAMLLDGEGLQKKVKLAELSFIEKMLACNKIDALLLTRRCDNVNLIGDIAQGSLRLVKKNIKLLERVRPNFVSYDGRDVYDNMLEDILKIHEINAELAEV